MLHQGEFIPFFERRRAAAVVGLFAMLSLDPGQCYSNLCVCKGPIHQNCSILWGILCSILWGILCSWCGHVPWCVLWQNSCLRSPVSSAFPSSGPFSSLDLAERGLNQPIRLGVGELCNLALSFVSAPFFFNIPTRSLDPSRFCLRGKELGDI